MLRVVRTALFLFIVFALPAASARAQDQSVAVITSPLEGAVVAGNVPIAGSATHPQFQRYELAFGYDPNPTDTWFSIQGPAATQVINAVLGRWDTTGIADGVYVLRLRVYWSETDYLDAFVRRLQVQNETPTVVPPAGETPATQAPFPPPALELTLTVEGAATQPMILLPPTSTPRATPVAGSSAGRPGNAAPRINSSVIQGAFLNGIGLTFIGFALLGMYLAVRAYVRAHPPR